jgi:hypothetical protein
VAVNSNFANVTDEEKDAPRRRRRADMEKVLQSLNLSNDVAILDFWNYTSHFHELHPPRDCTHYCSTPSFWLYLWRQMRVALDQRVQLLPVSSMTRK